MSEPAPKVIGAVPAPAMSSASDSATTPAPAVARSAREVFGSYDIEERLDRTDAGRTDAGRTEAPR